MKRTKKQQINSLNQTLGLLSFLLANINPEEVKKAVDLVPLEMRDSMIDALLYVERRFAQSFAVLPEEETINA